MLNIPIFRAKKQDSNEYVKGWYSEPIIIEGELYLSITNKDGTFRIDPKTLAINFPDILDSQGNEIFASLSEDGKAGDIMKDDEYYGIAKYKDSRFVVEYENVEECLYEGNFEVIGIQE